MSEARPVWVTGAGGFLGVAACLRLLEEGYAVRPLCRGPGCFEPVVDVRSAERLRPALQCDLAEEGLTLVVGEAPPVTIVHCAAELPTKSTERDVEGVAQRNRRIDDNVFAFARSVGAGVVFASGGNVYGRGRGEIFVEDGPTAPRGAYAAAKLRSEREGAAVLAAEGLPFAALRISAPYGPGQETQTVVRRFLSRAIAGRGLDYHGTGSRMQDFIYVTDVAEAICCCVVSSAGGVFNIASGEAITMKDLAATVAEVAGRPIRIAPSGEPDEQEGLTASYSIETAQRALAWTPATRLRHGVQLWHDYLVGQGE